MSIPSLINALDLCNSQSTTYHLVAVEDGFIPKEGPQAPTDNLINSLSRYISSHKNEISSEDLPRLKEALSNYKNKNSTSDSISKELTSLIQNLNSSEPIRASASAAKSPQTTLDLSYLSREQIQEQLAARGKEEIPKVLIMANYNISNTLDLLTNTSIRELDLSRCHLIDYNDLISDLKRLSSVRHVELPDNIRNIPDQKVLKNDLKELPLLGEKIYKVLNSIKSRNEITEREHSLPEGQARENLLKAANIIREFRTGYVPGTDVFTPVIPVSGMIDPDSTSFLEPLNRFITNSKAIPREAAIELEKELKSMLSIVKNLSPEDEGNASEIITNLHPHIANLTVKSKETIKETLIDLMFTQPALFLKFYEPLQDTLQGVEILDEIVDAFKIEDSKMGVNENIYTYNCPEWVIALKFNNGGIYRGEFNKIPLSQVEQLIGVAGSSISLDLPQEDLVKFLSTKRDQIMSLDLSEVKGLDWKKLEPLILKNLPSLHVIKLASEADVESVDEKWGGSIRLYLDLKIEETADRAKNLLRKDDTFPSEAKIKRHDHLERNIKETDKDEFQKANPEFKTIKDFHDDDF